ncbi:hypothetical protein [Agarivorans sp.]|uniref:hypothetical protein n=1 Tax=Agarivorans sp. TaxID=1872412 RepID=UPI003D0605F8
MNKRLKQNLRLFAPVLAFAVYMAGPQAEDLAELNALKDPFMMVDYDASIALLPIELQAQAREWRAYMKQLEDKFALDSKNTSLKTEVSFSSLYQQLDQLFAQAQIEPVKVNVLESLSNEQRLKALTLWKDIQRSEIDLLSQQYDATAEKAIDEKYAKLDAILASID